MRYAVVIANEDGLLFSPMEAPRYDDFEAAQVEGVRMAFVLASVESPDHVEILDVLVGDVVSVFDRAQLGDWTDFP